MHVFYNVNIFWQFFGELKIVCQRFLGRAVGW